MGLVRTLDRWGAVAAKPPVWALMAAGLGACGECGRRAAKRGAICYLTGAVISNGVKLFFKRPQPRHRRTRRPYVARSAFPSGHGASEVAFAFGAAGEGPFLLAPIGLLAILAHWSLVRSGKHYLSDMLVGGTIGIGIGIAAGRLRAPGTAGKAEGAENATFEGWRERGRRAAAAAFTPAEAPGEDAARTRSSIVRARPT